MMNSYKYIIILVVLVLTSVSAKAQSLSELFHEASSSVYMLIGANDANYSQGSCFVVNEKGLALSNYHVIENANNIFALNSDNEKFMVVEILEQNKSLDYVIFRLGPRQKKFDFVKISNIAPTIGESCFAIGNPHGLALTLSDGIISSIRDNGSTIQTSSEITHGSSGGPLFNSRGEVIGITTSGLGEANLNFAINIHNTPILEYIRNDKMGSSVLDQKSEPASFLRFIKSYYDVLVDEEYNSLFNYYARTLDRFFDRYNVSRSDAINDARNYKSRFGIIAVKPVIREQTFNYYKSIKGTYIIQYEMDYDIIRKDSTKPSHFDLQIILEIDRDKKIKSIYENILSKY